MNNKIKLEEIKSIDPDKINFDDKETVKNIITLLLEIIHAQSEIIQSLRDQLAKNSKNSSKPPSSDGLKKPRTRSLRKVGVKKNGGQNGHQGHTLELVENPDQTSVYEIKRCKHCRTSLEDEEVVNYEKRQVFDIPSINIEVTEHQAEIKNCPHCGMENKADFPIDVTQPVQYGFRIKSLAAYLNSYQLIPLERTCEFFEDIFEHRPSEAMVLQANTILADRVKPFVDIIKQQLINSPVINNDETGFRVEGKGHWLHVTSTDNLTYYGVHTNRGKKAMDDMGILPYFGGTSVHDHWKPYFKYDNSKHSLCNTHHLREITFIDEQYQQEWAPKMIELLIGIKEKVDETRKYKGYLDPSEIKKFENKYDEIVKTGFMANIPPPQKQSTKTKKRGRVKQTPAKNLLDRLKDYREETLRFMHNFQVPFDNNLGERDIRMMKVKQKVSGCFRTLEGAKEFCCIRSYISTARKNGCRIIKAIQDAFNGNPFIIQINMENSN